MKPFLLKQKCMVQRDICTAIKACPKNAVSYIEDEEEPLGGKILFDLDICDGCGICASECCGDAIEMR
jgi:Pyruvate/2-oxoacid:ferredoxin oxidoreductase delta subunit